MERLKEGGEIEKGRKSEVINWNQRLRTNAKAFEDLREILESVRSSTWIERREILWKPISS